MALETNKPNNLRRAVLAPGEAMARVERAARRNAAEEPAAPAYALGQRVEYVDRHERPQIGEVLAIEASWRFKTGRAPLIVYTLSHPSYAGRRMYATADQIRGAARG